MKRKSLSLLLFFYLGFLFGQTHPPSQWTDSIYTNMTLEQKIGQLFMVMGFSEGDTVHYNTMLHDIKEHHIGGIIFSKGSLQEQARLTNAYQESSQTPLLIAMDAEWGMAMRLQDVEPFPFQMTLGAIQNDSLLYQTGKAMAKRQRAMGVHWNFAPVVDSNTNPKNPIIGLRAFGSDPDLVSQKAAMLILGMEEGGLMACIKHFPGHGDTDKDSHKTLPKISHELARLQKIELAPFNSLISSGVSSVMVGHLEVPALEPKVGLPSSLSKTIVTDLLQNEMGFEGIVVTDALNMSGVADYDSQHTASLNAFLAGADLLLIPQDLARATQDLKQAYLSNDFSEARLAHSVKKILKAKYKAGLHQSKPVVLDELEHQLHDPEFSALQYRLAAASMTVVKNDKDLLPIGDLSDTKIAYIPLGKDDGTPFLERLQHYANVERLDLLKERTHLSSYSHLIVGIHQSDKTPWESHRLTPEEKELLFKLSRRKNVILVSFSNPYALQHIPLDDFEAVVLGYQNNPIAQSKAAQVVFGGLGANGQLPIDLGTFKSGDGLELLPQDRLSYGHPLQVGLDAQRLQHIDSMARVAIADSMTPGMQILVSRYGKVVYHKSFGYMRYDKRTSIDWYHRYDLASLTKILASLPLAMREQERDSLFLKRPIASLIRSYDGSNKSDVNFKQLFSHHAGIQPWIPFYKKTLDSITQQPRQDLYRNRQRKKHRIQIADQLHLQSTYLDSIETQIIDSPMLDSLYYKYSDLPYYMFKSYIETRYNAQIDTQFDNFLGVPMGLNYTSYNPLLCIDKEMIVPSEIDTYYRQQELQGYVHDMGAAMQDGVGGHAGLFSNANDVAKIMQMFLQGGHYGGKRYLQPQTINVFNQRYFADQNNRRGIGFDKQQYEDPGPTCLCASDSSFGHSGFTGTFAWADPEYGLLYVFLSNRTYPSMENTRLVDTNFRSEVQRVIYNALKK